MNAATQPIRILPFGNSITDGNDSTSPPEGQRISYRFSLYSLLTGAGYDFDFVGHNNGGYDIFPESNHGGIPGTRDQYLVRLLVDGYDERWGQQITSGGQPYLDVYPADIILLHIGTNDITHGEGTSPAAVSLILDEINAYEGRSGKDVIVFVAMIINRKSYNLTTTLYNNNVAAMVAARNDPDIYMVDMENGAGIIYSVEMQDDGLHPYPTGYSKMGQKWFESIQSLNEPPFFTSTPVLTAMEDMTYSYNVIVDDENPNDNLTIIAGTKPSWCTFVDNGDNTGLLTGIPDNADIGPNAVSLIVSDGKVLEIQNFNIIVTNTNDPPIITGQTNIFTDEDSPVTLSKEEFTIVDQDHPISEVELIVLEGDNYSVQNNTLTPEGDFFGTLSVNVKATDGVDEGAVYQALVTVDPVNDSPVIAGQKSSLEVKQGSTLEILVSDLYYEDIDNNINELLVIVQSDQDTLFTIDGNQITPIGDTIGLLEVRVALFDGENMSNEFPLHVNFLPSNIPPYFISDPPEQAIVDEVYFYLVDANDPDEDDMLTYKSTTLPDWLNFRSDLRLLGGSPSIGDTGTVWIGIEVTDGTYRVEQLYQVEVVLSTSDGSVDKLVDGQVREHGLINNIYPVPARDMLHISFLKNGEYLVHVVSLSGQLLSQQSIDGVARTEFGIDLSDLGPGTYFIRVFSSDKSDTRRFMINR